MNRFAVAFLAAVAVLFAAITVAKRGPGGKESSPTEADSSSTDRESVEQFWDHYRDATTHRMAGRIQEAASAYAAALAIDGRHEDALYYSGSMLFELGDLPDAEAAWRRLIEVNESSSRAHSQLGRLYLCYDRSDFFDVSSAEAQYRRAAQINPEETGPLLSLGEIALVRGDIAAAQATLDDVLISNSRSATAHLLRGYVAWKTGSTAEAAAHARSLLELTRDQKSETGLAEGETEAGVPMLAMTTMCSGLRGLVNGPRGAAPGTEADVMQLYRLADSVLIDARLKVP